MSFATPKSEMPGSYADNTPGRTGTYRQAEVVPLGFGRFRVAAKWITPVLNWRFRSGKTSSFAYFSGVGALCLGPVDEIVQIYSNGKPYNGLFSFREDSTADFVEHVVPKETPETFRIWWGTETQVPASWLTDLVLDPGNPMYGKVHPAYRGICYIGIKDMEAGSNASGQTPPLPNVEVEVSRRSPTAYSFGYQPYGTHPVGILKDMFQDKRGGLSLKNDSFDDAFWQSRMQRIMDDGVSGMRGENLFISPLFTQQKPAHELFSDVLSYIDGWLRWRNGKIEVDWYPGSGDATGVRELSWFDFTAEPEIEGDGLDKIVSQVAVTGLDWESPSVPLAEVVETAQVPYALQISGEPRVEQVQRPFYTTREQTRTYAGILAHNRAVPDLKGTIKVRRESATQLDGVTPLLPGDRFNLDYTPYELDLLCRITERTDSDDNAEVTLKFTRERGAYPTPYVPPLDPRVSINLPVAPAISNFAMTEVHGAQPRRVACLVERPFNTVVGYHVHYSPTNTWPGTVLDTFTGFAVSAILTTSLAANAADATVVVNANAVDWGRIVSQTATQQADDTLLMINNGEWFSVGTVTPNGSNLYTITLTRARQNSVPAIHSASERVFFVYRSELPTITHADFEDTSVERWFKVQAYSPAGDSSSISSAFGLFLGDRTPPAPVGFSAIAQPEAIVITWAPNTLADNIEETQIWEQATATPAPDFSQPPNFVSKSSSYFRGGLSAGTTKYYWGRNIDPEGRESAPEGPAAATASALTSGPQGDPGPPGPSGARSVTIYIISDIVPATPLGTNPPGWSEAMPQPSGTSALWVSTGYKDANGLLVGTWSTPRRLSGNAILYLHGITTPGTYLDGDLAYDLDDHNKQYRRTGGVWVALLKILTTEDFGTGIKPLENFPTLPSTGNFDGRAVFNTTDRKVYIFNGTSNTWKTGVDAVDIAGQLADAQVAALAASKITGQLTDSQIAALSAAKLLGTLTDAQLSAIAAAKITGTITSTQISDGAISTPKLAAGAVTASNIAAHTITASQIASQTITASEIAAASITGDRLLANTITAAQIAAGTITAGQIAANTITASQIAAGTITATQIAAGTITATQIAAGSITGDRITANTITGGQIQAGVITSREVGTNLLITSSAMIGSAIIQDANIANIDGSKINANSITASKITVGQLSAMASDMGYISAGEIHIDAGDFETVVRSNLLQQGRFQVSTFGTANSTTLRMQSGDGRIDIVGVSSTVPAAIQCYSNSGLNSVISSNGNILTDGIIGKLFGGGTRTVALWTGTNTIRFEWADPHPIMWIDDTAFYLQFTLSP
jgi:hypothetical protein